MSGAPLRAALALTALLLPGCVTTLYDWGPYESSVRATLREHQDLSLSDDLQRLAVHGAALREQDLAPPPGLHAHLGALYSLAGDLAAARRHLEAEKAWYPESAVFVDGLLERLR